VWLGPFLAETVAIYINLAKLGKIKEALAILQMVFAFLELDINPQLRPK